MFIENIPGENMNVDQKLVDFAVSIAKEAGDLTLSFFNDLNLEIIKKTDGSPVTEADRGAERLLRQRISDSFPEDSIIGEEEENVIGSSGRTWILDPIDGTQSFINGVTMLGGVTMNGETLYTQAQEEIVKLEEQIQLAFELPINHMIG